MRAESDVCRAVQRTRSWGHSFYLSLLVVVCQSWRSFLICREGDMSRMGWDVKY